MKKAMLTAVVLAFAMSANAAYVFEDFESYADTAAMNAAWVPHSGGAAVTQTLVVEGENQFMQVEYATGGVGWAQTRQVLDGAVWQSHGVNLTYPGFTGVSLDLNVTDRGGRLYFLMIDCWGDTVLRYYFSDGAPTPLTNGWVNYTFDFADTLLSGKNLENVYWFAVGSGSNYSDHPIGVFLVDNITLIPEPASLAILGLGSVALLKRRKRA